jgi:hypothetical protein
MNLAKLDKKMSITINNRGKEGEVLVYGRIYIEEFAPDLSKYKKISEKNGIGIYSCSEQDGGKIIYDSVIINGDTEIHLYGAISQKFYNENIETLNEMLLTMDF